MSRDPRQLARAARRRGKSVAARLGGVDEVRAQLAEVRGDLARARSERERVRAALTRAREEREQFKNDFFRARRERDERRERVSQLTAQVSDLKDRVTELKGTTKDLRGRLRETTAGAEQAEKDLRETRRQLESAREHQSANADKVTSFGYAYRRLRAAALGVQQPSDLGPVPGRPPGDTEGADAESELAWVQARSRLATALAEGAGLEAGVAAVVRGAHGPARMAQARAMSQWLHDTEATRTAGTLATGLIAHRMGLFGFARERLTRLPDEVWLRHAASEYVLVVGQEDRDGAADALRRALAHDAPLPTRVWLDLTRRAMGLDLGPLCTDLAERFAESARADLDAGELTDEDARALRTDLEWVGRWAPRVAAGPAVATPPTPGVTPFAVLGYDQPDPRNTSRNIGDHVQTLASLGHLVRHTGVRFEDDDLGRIATELADRVPAHRRVESPERRVSLHAVDRDASTYSSAPEGTWLLAFGWYAHRIGGVRHDFPFPDHLRPIYVSFHLAKRAMLTEETIAHLREHAPIGCRDHSTVDVLLGLGIPAFFSGCLTTTLPLLRPDDTPARPADAPPRHVDVPAPEGAEAVRNERQDVLHADLPTNLRSALTTVDDYAHRVGRVETGRLHAYLPARALGCEVDFTPKNPGDVRFAGLYPLRDEEVRTMGETISDLLEPVVTAILDGEDEGSVRATWSRVTAEHVAAARARHEAHVELPPLVDVDEAVATIRAGRTDVARTAAAPDGEEMQIVLALDGNLKEQFLVVVDGLVEHASRPLHLTVLVREHTSSDFERAAALFPSVSFTWFPCDEVTYGDIKAMVPHITISTMDRLVLPELLTDLDRVVYHDIDALPVGDIAPLHDIDLEGHPIAARDLEASVMQSGYSNIFIPAGLPDLEPGAGSELIRRETARHPFDWVGFNAGIMVLDLARMRADDFCRRFLPYAGTFGMHDQHILNVYAGADRLRLAPQWNARPSQEEVVDPSIIHWAGGQKPWGEGYVSFRGVWRRHEESVRERMAALAVTNDGEPVDKITSRHESL